MLPARPLPRWLTPEALVVGGFSAASASIAAALVETHLGGVAAWLEIAATLAASVLVALFALGGGATNAARAGAIGGVASDARTLLAAVGAGGGLWALAFGLGERSPLDGAAFGLTIGLLPSVVAGFALSVLARGARSARMFGGHDAVERVALAAGTCAGVCGALAIGVAGRAGLAVASASTALGLALVALAWRRDAARAAWLRDVYDGKSAEYRVVPLDDTDVREQIAPLVPGSTADAVLVASRAATPGAGPYRAEERPRPVALLARDGALGVGMVRAHAQRATLSFVLTIALAGAAAVARAEQARAEAARAASPPVEPIACSAARAVFEMRAMESSDVSQALFLTHAEDARVPSGEARLSLALRADDEGRTRGAPRALRADDEATLRARLAEIPCRGVPRIVVAPAAYRVVDLDVTLDLAPGEDPHWITAAVLDEIIADFEGRGPNAVRFGYHDRKVAWRARASANLITGVRGAKVRVSGADDVALAPDEIARLGAVVVVDGASGYRLPWRGR